mmetsp:Transcript_30288/g.53247  ORF Transcript_30288/g.53247 Transcript_30288/m.53247 type:complete len:406 (+) Transcript_30288:119-1336(+)
MESYKERVLQLGMREWPAVDTSTLPLPSFASFDEDHLGQRSSSSYQYPSSSSADGNDGDSVDDDNGDGDGDDDDDNDDDDDGDDDDVDALYADLGMFFSGSRSNRYSAMFSSRHKAMSSTSITSSRLRFNHQPYITRTTSSLKTSAGLRSSSSSSMTTGSSRPSLLSTDYQRNESSASPSSHSSSHTPTAATATTTTTAINTTTTTSPRSASDDPSATHAAASTSPTSSSSKHQQNEREHKLIQLKQQAKKRRLQTKRRRTAVTEAEKRERRKQNKKNKLWTTVHGSAICGYVCLNPGKRHGKPCGQYVDKTEDGRLKQYCKRHQKFQEEVEEEYRLLNENTLDPIDYTTKKYCLCNDYYQDGDFMIACDECDDWFHGECIGISEEQGLKMDSYICQLCKETAAF